MTRSDSPPSPSFPSPDPPAWPVRPPAIPNRLVEAADFGVVPGRIRTDSRPGLQGALDACAASGGGLVRVAAGDYFLDGPLHLRSRVRLHLEDRAYLRFGFRPDAYLPGPPAVGGGVLVRWEGTLLYNYCPMLYAREVTDLALTGGGTLDGQGDAGWRGFRDRQAEDRIRAMAMNEADTPLVRRVFGRGCFLRPQLVSFVDCERVWIEGPTFADAGFWVVHPVFCRDVTIRRVRFDCPGINSDGIDPDSCQSVLVEDVAFGNGDDNLAIKSGRDAEGLRLGRPSERIHVRRCHFSGLTGFAIGSEVAGGARDILVEDCTGAPGLHTAIHIKTNRNRGGVIERVRARRLAFGACAWGLRIDADYKRQRDFDRFPGIRDLDFADLAFEACSEYDLHVRGWPERPLERIDLSNVVFRTPGRRFVESAEVRDSGMTPEA